MAGNNWSDWNGGEPPVNDLYTLVDVRRSDGSENIAYAARHVDWRSRSRHHSTPCVVAWRLSKREQGK